MSGVDRSAPFLEIRGISKSFGHIEAVADVDLEAHLGEVLAIVGDNGAGKSTLMSVLIGLQRPTHGTIRVAGLERQFGSPNEAVGAGISAVTQNLALVECLDVATNMFMGQFPRRWGFVDKKKMDADARLFLDSVKATVPDVRLPIGMLSGGQRQMVSIARALRTGAQLVVMDEPTAALGVRETAQVVDLIRNLKEQGRGVIIVSHDIELVFLVADRVQVMRRGRSVATVDVAETSQPEIISLITGASTWKEPIDVH